MRTPVNQSWSPIPQIEPSPELIAFVGGHPLIARLLAQRGYETPEQANAFLNPDAYTPAEPTRLFGVAESARLLYNAIQQGQNILVWGDFDVDGQTSTSLLVAALRKLTGPERVHYHVPNRFSEGHGILPEKLTEVLEASPIPIHVLLTCDTGIDEGPAIGLAKDLGLSVVITDHHDVTPEFHPLTPGVDPLWGLDKEVAGQDSVRRADAIVNPKFQPDDDPLRTLPGVGVAYKLIQEIYTLAGCRGDEQTLLDLVALGIVADVAEQVDDARYLLQRGLDQLRNTQRVGLLALMDVAHVVPGQIDSESIGFQIGPRMNALGRLEDATVAVELLTTDDPIRAAQLAATMEKLNGQRRLLTSQTAAAAMEMIDRNPQYLDFNGLVLAHPAWHAGIVGIVASRLAEEYNKPTVLLLTPEGKPARGSARSITGVDIGGSIAACSHLLYGHGGHPGAAGLSLDAGNIDRFRRELSRQIELHRQDDAPDGLLIDAEVPLGDLDLALAEELQRLAPYGQGNPIPKLLSRNLTISDDRRIGRDGTHRKMAVTDALGKATQTVIWFHGADTEIPTGAIDLVYNLSINEYRGKRSLQLQFVAIRPAKKETLDGPTTPVDASVIHDLRGQPLRLSAVPSPDEAAWYAEGVDLTVAEHTEHGQPALAPRFDLPKQPKERPLVIWTIPPSSKRLHWLIETTEPSAIYLCGQNTTDDRLSGVLRSVAGMCRYALGQDGLLYLDRMAARLGLTEAVIRQCLLWLKGKGLIKLVEWTPTGQTNDTVRIEAGSGEEDCDGLSLAQAELDEQLAEVRAYRRFFMRAGLKELGLI